jgi:predicted Zn-ribbon and HTH transcriptional regulator
MASDDQREARLTLPKALREALRGATPKGLAQLSRELRVSEKELPDALAKLKRSLLHSGEALKQEPPRCIARGFEFEALGRARRPSRCPRCSSERLTKPRFWIG